MGKVNWWALPLLPLLIPLALVAALFKKPLQKSADQMVVDMRNFVAFAEGNTEWQGLDAFESVPLADPVLEALRGRALAGPPGCDVVVLRQVLAEAETLAAERRDQSPQ